MLASAEFVKKHNLQDKAVEILGMEMATDLSSTFNENSCIKLVSGLTVKSREKEPAFSQVSLHRRRSRGTVVPLATPPHVLVPKNTFTDVFDNTGDITTSERTFSALRRLMNYLRSTMKQDRLNNCLRMHCRKSITDTLDIMTPVRPSLRLNRINTVCHTIELLYPR